MQNIARGAGLRVTYMVIKSNYTVYSTQPEDEASSNPSIWLSKCLHLETSWQWPL